MTMTEERRVSYALIVLPGLAILMLGASGGEAPVMGGWWDQILRPVLIGLMSAVGGAAVVGLKVSWWLSGWKTTIEHRISSNAARLDNGKEAIDKIPHVVSRMERVTDMFEKAEDKMDGLDSEYRRVKECDLQHEAIHDQMESLKQSYSRRINEVEKRLSKMEDALAEHASQSH